MEPVDIAQVIEGLRGIFENDLRSRRIDLIVDTRLPTLNAEKMRLRQLFQNLIDNAIKYMGDGPTREIHIGCGMTPTEAEFYVRDTGIGIDPDDIEKVFFVFRRGRNTIAQSIAGKGVSQLVLHEGDRFTVHLKGLGWTELDNTTAVDYYNSYIGYGCGFNSQGDTVMNLVATGGPGTHRVDMYPLLYTNSPSYANTPYGMIPLLTYERDAPGLALGYRLPVIRLAITIVR